MMKKRKKSLFDVVQHTINSTNSPRFIKKNGKTTRQLQQMVEQYGEDAINNCSNSLSPIRSSDLCASQYEELDNKFNDIFKSKATLLVKSQSIAFQSISLYFAKQTIAIQHNIPQYIHNALLLFATKIVYIYPTHDETYGYQPVTASQVQAAISQNDSIKAVILESPNCSGLQVDYQGISAVLNGRSLIIDESRGLSVYFGNTDIQSAMQSSADISVVSVPKQFGSISDHILINVGTWSNVNIVKLKSACKIISPLSVPMIDAVDIESCISDLKRQDKQNYQNIKQFIQKQIQQLPEDIKIINFPDFTKDPLTISIQANNLQQIYNDLLKYNSNISVFGQTLSFQVAIHTTKEQIQDIFNSLTQSQKSQIKQDFQPVNLQKYQELIAARRIILSPIEIYSKDFKHTSISKAVGKISADSLSINNQFQVLTCGELILNEHLAVIEKNTIVKVVI